MELDLRRLDARARLLSLSWRRPHPFRDSLGQARDADHRRPKTCAAAKATTARKASENFPDVWPGGEWKLRNITDYMTTAAFSLMKHAAQNRERWLQRFYEVGKEAVRERKDGELFAFTLPPSDDREQNLRRAALLNVLRRGGVEVDYTAPPNNRPVDFFNWTAVVRLSQPYGAFAKALLEAQHYLICAIPQVIPSPRMT